jgi:NTP pyrophosphatase (non-canonical NTP hydrolase)
MYYLSDKLLYGRDNRPSVRGFSEKMLEQNGWRDQFIITKKSLYKYSAAVLDFAESGLFRTTHKPELIKRIVIILITTRHLTHHLNIKPRELKQVGFTGYRQKCADCQPKIPRTFKKVFGQEYKLPDVKFNILHELNNVAEQVLEKQKQTYGEKRGMQYQLVLASEEAGELGKEISKYYRADLVGDTAGLVLLRETIVEELFDTLFTILYVMECAGITIRDLNDFARIYIPQLYSKHVIDVCRDKLER